MLVFSQSLQFYVRADVAHDAPPGVSFFGESAVPDGRLTGGEIGLLRGRILGESGKPCVRNLPDYLSQVNFRQGRWGTRLPASL